jgi:hypothetical protein
MKCFADAGTEIRESRTRGVLGVRLRICFAVRCYRVADVGVVVPNHESGCRITQVDVADLRLQDVNTGPVAQVSQ